MTGIVFEVVAAFGISIISGLEIASLNERAAGLEVRATSNEVARVQLEKELREFSAPRTISQEQSNKFISIVKDFPKGDIRIGVNWPDRETSRYATQIRVMLQKAGYTIPSFANYGEPVPYSETNSVAFVTWQVHGSPIRAVKLQRALFEIGINTQALTNTANRFFVETNDVLVLVGPKF